MPSSKPQPSPSTVRQSCGPVTELSQVPTALAESYELAMRLEDKQLAIMLGSIVDLLFEKPDEFVASVTKGDAHG